MQGLCLTRKAIRKRFCALLVVANKNTLEFAKFCNDKFTFTKFGNSRQKARFEFIERARADKSALAKIKNTII